MPEAPSVVDFQSGSVAVGQLDLDEAAPGQGQSPDYPGWERQATGEAGVRYGLDLDGFAATPPPSLRGGPPAGPSTLSVITASPPPEATCPRASASLWLGSPAADVVSRPVANPE